MHLIHFFAWPRPLKQWWNVYVAASILTLLIVFTINLTCFRRSIKIDFGDGRLAKIVDTSPIRLSRLGSCFIKFYSNKNEIGMVKMLQCQFASPIIIVSSTNKNVYYCVYDDDSYDLLLKFDLSRQYSARHVSLNNFEPLRNIVLNSTFWIENTTKADVSTWQFASDALKRMPPHKFIHDSVVVDYPFFNHHHYDQEETIESISHFGGQGQMNGETVIVGKH